MNLNLTDALLLLGLVQGGVVIHATLRRKTANTLTGFTSAFGIEREKKWGVVYFTNANQVSAFGFELFTFLHE